MNYLYLTLHIFIASLLYSPMVSSGIKIYKNFSKTLNNINILNNEIETMRRFEKEIIEGKSFDELKSNFTNKVENYSCVEKNDELFSLNITIGEKNFNYFLGREK